jgi:hypothetical protein
MAHRRSAGLKHSAAVPDEQRARVLEGLRRFVDRVPPQVRPQLSYATREHGSVFTLVERRPDYRSPSRTVELEIAKLRYNVAQASWTLLRTDRHSRWYTYEGFEDHADVDELIREIEADPYHLFFG